MSNLCRCVEDCQDSRQNGPPGEQNQHPPLHRGHLEQGLKNFADEFPKLQDYQQTEVERFEAQVVEALKLYGTIVKTKQDDLKATGTARNPRSLAADSIRTCQTPIGLAGNFTGRNQIREPQRMLPKQLVIWRKLLTTLRSRK